MGAIKEGENSVVFSGSDVSRYISGGSIPRSFKFRYEMNLFGLTANLIDASFLILGKGGKFLNARGNRICFLIDLICLSYWMVMDIQRGLYSQGISCTISMSLCIYGFIRWGKKPPMRN